MLRSVGQAERLGDAAAQVIAHGALDAALGERGPPWWTDGVPDLNRTMAKNGCCAEWYEGLSPGSVEISPQG